jgi:hypothetical protein
VRPRSIECGIKAVYSSLWNARAIEERTFARMDHAQVGMGVGVVPAYDTESEVIANGVLITRVIGSSLTGYTVSLQEGNNLVTNPDVGTIAQTSYAVLGYGAPRMVLARYATPKKGGPPLTRTVIADEKLVEVIEAVRAAEVAYCRIKPGYNIDPAVCSGVWYDSSKNKALDFEFKLLANGHYVIKQMREFGGR